MRITAKGEYALLALLELARTYETNMVHSLDEIAERQQIPHQFLVQIFQSLRHAKFVQSRRGAAGGYKLAKPPGEITVAEVLELVEGELFSIHDGTHLAADSPAGRAAATLKGLWGEIETSIRSVVENTTLEDLRERLATNGNSMYYI